MVCLTLRDLESFEGLPFHLEGRPGRGVYEGVYG